ncbi:hypothetical protein ACLMJK_001976 [Lecanora helva]
MSGGLGFLPPPSKEPCPANKRTFNSDGTRVDEVGLKDWNNPNPEKARGEENPKDQRSKKEDIAIETMSMTSGMSGDTLKEDTSKSKTSLLKKILHRERSKSPNPRDF